jgi:hypothetical protein
MAPEPKQGQVEQLSTDFLLQYVVKCISTFSWQVWPGSVNLILNSRNALPETISAESALLEIYNELQVDAFKKVRPMAEMRVATVR